MTTPQTDFPALYEKIQLSSSLIEISQTLHLPFDKTGLVEVAIKELTEGTINGVVFTTKMEMLGLTKELHEKLIEALNEKIFTPIRNELKK